MARRIPDTNTVERLRAAGAQTWTAEQTAAMVDAFHHIQRIRLERQIAASEGEPSNRVDPDRLHELDRLILKETFKQIRLLQRSLTREYAPS